MIFLVILTGILLSGFTFWIMMQMMSLQYPAIHHHRADLRMKYKDIVWDWPFGLSYSAGVGLAGFAVFPFLGTFLPLMCLVNLYCKIKAVDGTVKEFWELIGSIKSKYED